MKKTVHLIRHGQSTFNAAYGATGVDPLHRDAPLTDLGREQVAKARIAYAGLGHELVVTSPLTRAIETALGLFGGGSAPILVEVLHRERQWESCDIGRSPAVLASEFPMLRFEHLDDPWWHDGNHDANGIPRESEAAFAARLGAFRAWLKARPERVLTVIGHGTFFGTLTGRPFANCELFSWEL